MMDAYHLELLEKGRFECRDIFKNYTEYFEGDLPLSLSEKMEEHIETCKECKQFSEEYEVMIKAVTALRNMAYKQTATDKKNLRLALAARLGI